MKAIILAGGRGQRLGSIGRYIQKGSLSFQGRPLIVHVIDNLLTARRLKNIVVAMGYRGEDINRIILQQYPEHLKNGILRVADFPSVQGNLSRLAATLNVLEKSEGYFICGVDSLIHPNVLCQFLHRIESSLNYTFLLLSPRLAVAYSHALVVMEGSKVVSYRNVNRNSDFPSSLPDHYIDSGIRYFPADLCLKIKKEGSMAIRYIPHFMAQIISQGWKVEGEIFLEEWRHFAFAKDFI